MWVEAKMGAVTRNPVRTHTYVLNPNYNPITFGTKTNIDVSSGDGVYGGLAASWIVTNKGSIQGGADGVDLTSSGSSVTNAGSPARAASECGSPRAGPSAIWLAV
jgi:hypothetical protein